MALKSTVCVFVLAAFCGAETSCKERNEAEVKIWSGTPPTVDSPAYRSTIKIVTNRGSTCSGVLIDAQLVLTAAHCVYPAGSVKITFEAIPPMSESISIVGRGQPHEAFVPKEPFDIWEPVFDIGLVFLERAAPAPYQPAALVAPDELPAEGTSYILAGYGLHHSDSEPGVRYQIERKLTSVVNLPDRPQLLYFAPDRAGGAAPGDSGGPAYVLSAQDKRFVVGGVTSFGYYAALGEAFYTSVQGYLSWIDEKSGRALHRKAPEKSLRTPTPQLDEMKPYAIQRFSCDDNSSLNFSFYKGRAARLSIDQHGGQQTTWSGMIVNIRGGDPDASYPDVIAQGSDVWRFIDEAGELSYEVSDSGNPKKSTRKLLLLRRGDDRYESIIDCGKVSQ